jgi:hypothetical protein
MFLPPRVQGMLVICVVGKDRFETGEMVRKTTQRGREIPMPRSEEVIQRAGS